jgi:predicted SAM-dependent methyltransferase
MIPRIKTFIREKVPFALPAVASIRHRASKGKIRRLLEQRREIFVELGAGEKGGRGDWITIDMTKKCDIYWDLRRGIPFPDASIHKLYSSHFFEHLSFEEIQSFLDDCMRVLAPGGQFSICVPNARLFIEAYSKGDSADAAALCGFTPAYNHTTRIDCVNYMAYMGGAHKYMFDEENLLFILRSKGLRNVRLRPFDPGLDLREREFESIYAEAEK